jgi:methylenetetrahydrofolate dehydrogenase (NADP+)/methenyltetrahydrofolate cyclohydrolase
VVLVGEDPASQVYVRNKVNACTRGRPALGAGKHPATLTEAELLARIRS